MGLRGSRGFSLLEVTIAVAIAALVGYFLLQVSVAAMHWAALQGTRNREHTAIASLVDRIEAEEDSAWAIFTPPNDVLGSPNADGHELDFFNRDGKGRSYFWAYRYDSTAQTLSRYLYPTPNSTPALDETFEQITGFKAQTFPITSLQDASSPNYSPLYSGATLNSGIVHFYPALPWIAGGNNITHVHIESPTLIRDLQLSTQTAPTGFTVVLRYTPTPSATPSGLSVWPAAVRYAVQGTQLASASTPSFAATLNALLGGSIALASGCTAQAFTDSTYSTPIADGTQDPYGAGVAVTGPNGCYDGSIAMHDAQFTGSFRDLQAPDNACSTAAVLSGGWTPYTRIGPTAKQSFSGGSQTTMECTLSFGDATSAVANATAQVIQPCWTIGGSCTYTMEFLDTGGGSCDPTTGETSAGYTGKGISSITPADGSWVADSSGLNYTFTRRALGEVAVSVMSQLQTGHAAPNGKGGYRCSYSMTYNQTSSLAIPSI